ncbi:MAG: UPF0489 family protein [Pseudomonadota bacterium]
MLVDISHALKEDDKYFEEIAKDIWLMDNHRWAYYVWETNRDKFKNHKAPIVHIDYHWDAGDDFYHSPEKEAEFKSLTIKQIWDMVSEGNWIRFDSFICPAIIRGICNEVHFLCFQGDGDDEGIYEGTLNKHSALQHIYRSSSELKNLDIKTPYFFDFCVDVFNRSDVMYTSDIWRLNEIDELLENIKHLVIDASIVTISMSYGYSGTSDDTSWLTRHVVGKFCSWRE